MFWDICVQDWTDPTQGDEQISIINANLILEAWWTRWLVKQEAEPHFFNYAGFNVRVHSTDFNAPTLIEALALAITAVLDEREK